MKSKIKVGDHIKVINPEFFVRCGYPLCLADVREKLGKDLGTKIDDFVDEVMGCTITDRRFIIDDRKNREVYNRILTALSRFYMVQNRFGGSERKIFTKSFPDRKGKTFVVHKKSVKITGYYVKGWSDISYYGDGEYQPPYLENQKRHNLLHLSVETLDSNIFSVLEAMSKFELVDLEDFFIIEDIHVEKVEQNNLAALEAVSK